MCATVGGVCRRRRRPIARPQLVPSAQRLARCLRLRAHCPRANGPVLDGRVLGDRGAEVGTAACGGGGSLGGRALVHELGRPARRLLLCTRHPHARCWFSGPRGVGGGVLDGHTRRDGKEEECNEDKERVRERAR